MAASTVAPGGAAAIIRDLVPTIIIVDDNLDFLASAEALLNEEGFEVVGCVSDSSLVVAEVRRLRPTLVLLDIQLPQPDGFALAERLAHLDPAPVVVLISSRDAATYGAALRRAPVRGFIAKGELSGEALAALV